MRIGLYSKLARAHIVTIRSEIGALGADWKDLMLDSVRKNIFASDKTHHKKILSSIDFYTRSAIRDLLFHEQEYLFSLPEISDSLDELGLVFCGFENAEIVSEFLSQEFTIDDLCDLGKWNSFERRNPRIFSGMYQFWCQKTKTL